jgi:hypothetical protein
VTREVRDFVPGQVIAPADYGELGALMITATLIGLALPLLAILFSRMTRFRNA